MDLSWLFLPALVFSFLAGMGVVAWGIAQIAKWEKSS
jgi:hypothetical protein